MSLCIVLSVIQNKTGCSYGFSVEIRNGHWCFKMLGGGGVIAVLYYKDTSNLHVKVLCYSIRNRVRMFLEKIVPLLGLCIHRNLSDEYILICL